MAMRSKSDKEAKMNLDQLKVGASATKNPALKPAGTSPDMFDGGMGLVFWGP